MPIRSRLSLVYKKSASKYKNLSTLSKVLTIFAVIIFISFSVMFSIGMWYKRSISDQPMNWGMSWSFKYARELGIDPYDGLDATLTELPLDRIRLMSYWDEHESERDVYDWSELDWQIARVQQEGDVKIALAIGLRQPRWPECHPPAWTSGLPKTERNRELNEYIAAVVNRYDDIPEIVEYQLENEFLIKSFGECDDHDRQRLVDEYQLVKTLTDKPIVVSRSNNFAPSWPVRAPRADLTAMSIYKRVFDVYVTKQYFEYPFPSWYYSFLAGGAKMTTGVDTFIHELQAEPYGPTGTIYLSDEEQAKSMDAERLEKRLEFAHSTGIRTIDAWGAEWFYWRKTTRNDPSLWQTFIDKTQTLN